MASCSRAICSRCCRRSVPRTLAQPFASLCRPVRQPIREHAFASSLSSPLRSLRTSATQLRSSTPPLSVLGVEYATDDYSNLSSSILSRITREPRLPASPSHPLQLLNEQIHRSLADFTIIKPPSPIVSVEENFGQLGIAEDHPGRSPTDTYYLNRQTCLRTHTSAHEVQTFAAGNTKWTLTADVFRRDEIDASHYPIFHQMEGACIYDIAEYGEGQRVVRECEAMEGRLRSAQIEIEDNVDIAEAGGYQASHERDPAKRVAAQLAMRHLKATLNNLVLDLFGDRHEAGSSQATAEPLQVRWIAAEFPFTTPSFEVEVLFRGKWLEILGSGVVMDKTLIQAGVEGKLGWAFGLGLERIAMVLFAIPDIRLFWSQDPRFLSQFAPQKAPPATSLGEHAGVSAAGGSGLAKKLPAITFKPYSKYPACYKDVSFWLPSSFHENDLFEIIRDVAGDLTEDVVKIDDFTHPTTQKRSKCYRINYRSMDRNLENEEVNTLHGIVTTRMVKELGVELR